MDQLSVTVAKYARNNSIAKAAAKFNLTEDEVRAHKKACQQEPKKEPVKQETQKAPEQKQSTSVEEMLDKIGEAYKPLQAIYDREVVNPTLQFLDQKMDPTEYKLTNEVSDMLVDYEDLVTETGKPSNQLEEGLDFQKGYVLSKNTLKTLKFNNGDWINYNHGIEHVKFEPRTRIDERGETVNYIYEVIEEVPSVVIHPLTGEYLYNRAALLDPRGILPPGWEFPKKTMVSKISRKLVDHTGHLTDFIKELQTGSYVTKLFEQKETNKIALIKSANQKSGFWVDPGSREGASHKDFGKGQPIAYFANGTGELKHGKGYDRCYYSVRAVKKS